MEIIKKSAILVGQEFSTKEEATKLAGKLLLDNESIQEEYIDSMLEKLVSNIYQTYIPGTGIAMPHGMNDSKKYINEASMSIIQSPAGVDWNGEKVHLIFGLAVAGEEHTEIIKKISNLILEDMDKVNELSKTASIDELYEFFSI
tara:strand:- start:1507 stop:1941 length:435 start_codon:yes stop_codon:yes gene_type:complete